MLPSGVRFRVYAGQAGDITGNESGIGERRAMMERISGKTEVLFINRALWRVSYHSGGELIGSSTVFRTVS
jgi:hypothetical protein